MEVINNNKDGLEELLSYFSNSPSSSEATTTLQVPLQSREEMLRANAKYQSPRVQQMRYLLPRAWKNALRNRLMLQARLIQMIILGILIGLVYLTIMRPAESDPLATAQSITGAFFFVAVNMLFSAAMPVLSIFAGERPVFLREYMGGYYGAFSYYWSKTLVELPFNIVFPALFATIAYWMMGFVYSVTDWLIFVLFSVLVALTGAAFGICSASVFEDIGVALTAVPLIILPLMLYGGLLINTKTSFAWLSWIQW
jgi:ABC-type multidrug transport system permease subunit